VNEKLLAGLATFAMLIAACGPTISPTATPTRPPSPTSVQATSTPAPAGGTPSNPSPTPAKTASPTAAVAGPSYGGTIYHPQRSDPPSWDPTLTTVDPMATSRNIAFNKLFTQWPDPIANCTSTLTPVLVKDWKWLDDTTAEMTLKPGIKFHNKAPVNGRELVAQDVATSMERYRSLVEMTGFTRLVDKVDVVDKYTFRFKLKQPWGGLAVEMLSTHSGLWLAAQESGGARGELWTDPEKSWIGTGPFMFDKWTPGVKWSMVKNPEYWGKGKPYVDRVEYLVMPDTSTQLAAMRSGRLNLIRDLNQVLIGELEKEVSGLQVVRCTAFGYSGANILFMNSSGPPFNDVRVRRAVAMSVDRQAIVDTAYGGRAAVLGVLAPNVKYAVAIKDFPPDLRQYVEYHPDRAKALLADAGYGKGLDLTLNINTQYPAPASAIAEMIIAMLGQVGIRAKLKPMSSTEFSNTVLQAKYPAGEMAITPILQQTPEDGNALRNPSSKYSSTNNRSMINDPEYDRIYEEFITSRDEAKRTELARQLQFRHVDQAYRVILPLGESTMVGRPDVHNIFWIGGAREYGPVMENIWVAH